MSCLLLVRNAVACGHMNQFHTWFPHSSSYNGEDYHHDSYYQSCAKLSFFSLFFAYPYTLCPSVNALMIDVLKPYNKPLVSAQFCMTRTVEPHKFPKVWGLHSYSYHSHLLWSMYRVRHNNHRCKWSIESTFSAVVDSLYLYSHTEACYLICSVMTLSLAIVQKCHSIFCLYSADLSQNAIGHMGLTPYT